MQKTLIFLREKNWVGVISFDWVYMASSSQECNYRWHEIKINKSIL